MKIETSGASENILSEDLTEKNFGILANEKMFSILSSKIYTDKIAAPIREIGCNAYDAHVIAGKKDVPFKVHLPIYDLCNPEESYFAVEDEGPGMDAREIEELYTTYGFSSKTNSNRFIGCLGLGSKSPFAYSNMFQITSRKNGKQYIYQCVIESGMPKLIKFDESDTDQKSGVKVEFKVDQFDCCSFQNKAAEIFRYFNPRPIFNKELELGENPVFNHDIAIINNGYYAKEHKVLMGNVVYNYNIRDMKDSEEYDTFYDEFQNIGTLLKANIGDVDVSVSRENLEMTDKTVSFILKKHKFYRDQILKEFQATKGTYPSKFDYLHAYKKFLNSHTCCDKTEFNLLADQYSIEFEGTATLLTIINNYCSPIRSSRELNGKFYYTKATSSFDTRFVFVEDGKAIRSTSAINNYVEETKNSMIYLFNSENLKAAFEKEGIKVESRKDFIFGKDAYEVKEKDKKEKRLEGFYAIDRNYGDSERLSMCFWGITKEELDKLEKAEHVLYVKTKRKAVLATEITRLSPLISKEFFLHISIPENWNP